MPFALLVSHSFFLSFFLYSLSCWLLVVAYCLAPDLRRLQTLALVLGGAPPWSYSLALVVLLGPVSQPWRCSCSVLFRGRCSSVLFIGLGGAPAWSSSLALAMLLLSHLLSLWPCLSTPPWLLGLTSVLPLASLVLSTKPTASVLLLSSLVPPTKPSSLL